MSTHSLQQALAGDQFLVRQKVFKLLGEAFHVYDPAGNLLLYCKLKAFKLKEDIRLFASEAQEVPLLVIKARSILDFGAAYDVIDLTAGGGAGGGFQAGQTLQYAANAEGGQKVGALRRKGLKSMFRDAWEILDAGDNVIGTIQEDSGIKALVRRFVDFAATVMPQAFHGEIGGQRAFEFRQNFNPFVKKLQCDFSMDPQKRMDRRLGMAAAILLAAIEGRQG